MPLAEEESNPNLEPPSQVLAKLKAVLERFDITFAEAQQLVVLQEYEMVIIADDSKSMVNPADPVHKRVLGKLPRTRWDELKQTVSEMVEIASCFDESGVDVYFLNRPDVKGVQSSTDQRLVAALQRRPDGKTPLTETLQRVAQKTWGERKLLLFILTDGEPDGGTQPFLQAVGELLRMGKVRIQIMACTYEKEEMAWLNGMDKKYLEIDVTDDYENEREEVLKAEFAKRFTRADWCMKAMLGAVSDKFDQWDEKDERMPLRTQTDDAGSRCNLSCSGGGCVIV